MCLKAWRRCHPRGDANSSEQSIVEAGALIEAMRLAAERPDCNEQESGQQERLMSLLEGEPERFKSLFGGEPE